ncbi:MAG: hypothetical protein ACP5IM_03970 [Candidatus Bathyarchaeia archaeon]
MDEELVASELKGNTLRVYWFLLEHSGDSVGPRTVQKKLGFSSPALAAYHLEKLVELGLAEKASGEYQLKKIVNVGVLRCFLRIGGFVVPRYMLYLALFLTLLAFFVINFKEVNFYSLYALIFGLLGTGILVYETFRAWKIKP